MHEPDRDAGTAPAAQPTPTTPSVAKLVFLIAGTLSLALSVGLWFLTEDRETAIFVGLWVPSLFSLGALVAAGEGER
jgi:hypothetical protein